MWDLCCCCSDSTPAPYDSLLQGSQGYSTSVECSRILLFFPAVSELPPWDAQLIPSAPRPAMLCLCLLLLIDSFGSVSWTRNGAGSNGGLHHRLHGWLSSMFQQIKLHKEGLKSLCASLSGGLLIFISFNKLRVFTKYRGTCSP